jgi:hypothetical protein
MQHNNKKYHKLIIVHFTIFLANVYIILVEWPEPPNGISDGGLDIAVSH